MQKSLTRKPPTDSPEKTERMGSKLLLARKRHFPLRHIPLHPVPHQRIDQEVLIVCSFADVLFHQAVQELAQKVILRQAR